MNVIFHRIYCGKETVVTNIRGGDVDCLVCNDPNIGAKKEVKTTILEVVLAALGSLACTKKLQV